MNVATFAPASLQAQLDELRRERLMRNKVYPHMIASRKIDANKAAHNNRGLDGAIATLERLRDAQDRGEPGRSAMIDLLRDMQGHVSDAALEARLADMLAKVST